LRLGFLVAFVLAAGIRRLTRFVRVFGFVRHLPISFCLSEALFETELVLGLEQGARVSIYTHRAGVVEFLFSESTAQQSY
jgi:hypothetical protein